MQGKLTQRYHLKIKYFFPFLFPVLGKSHINFSRREVSSVCSLLHLQILLFIFHSCISFLNLIYVHYLKTIIHSYPENTEVVSRGCSVKKVFLEIQQNSQENTCPRVSFLIKLQASRPATLLKRRLWNRCFPVNFANFQ